MKLALEIRAGEGGDDAKDLVGHQAMIYAAYCRRHGLDLQVEDEGRG